LPELPDEKYQRFIKKFNLGVYDAEILTREQKVAEYFEEAVKAGEKHKVTPKQIANILINQKLDIEKKLPAKLIQNIITQTQKTMFDPKELKKIIKKVSSQNPKAVKDYKGGKEAALGFLIGQVQRELKGLADSADIKNSLLQTLKP